MTLFSKSVQLLYLSSYETCPPHIRLLAQCFDRPLPLSILTSQPSSSVSPIARKALLQLQDVIRDTTDSSSNPRTKNSEDFSDSPPFLDITLSVRAKLKKLISGNQGARVIHAFLDLILNALTRGIDPDMSFLHTSICDRFVLPMVVLENPAEQSFMGSSVALVSCLIEASVDDDLNTSNHNTKIDVELEEHYYHEVNRDTPSDSLEEDILPNTTQEASDDNISPKLPDTGIPLDAHVLYRATNPRVVALPLLLVALPDQIVALMTSVLYQRYVWSCEAFPVVGLSMSSGAIVQVVLGWLEEKRSSEDDTKAIVPHIVFPSTDTLPQPSTGYYDLTDPQSSYAFSQFVSSLKHHFEDVASTASTFSFRKFCWRSDHGFHCPDEDLNRWDPNKKVANWIRSLDISDSQLCCVDSYKPDSITASSGGEIEKSTHSSVLLDLRPRQSSRLPSQDLDARTESSSSVSIAQISSSSLAEVNSPQWDRRMPTRPNCMMDRAAFSIGRVRGLKDTCSDRLNIVKEMTQQYDTMVRPPKLLPASEDPTSIDPQFEPFLSTFLQAVRDEWGNVTPDDDQFVSEDFEITQCIFERISVFIYSWQSAVAVQESSKFRTIYEQDSRKSWDTIFSIFHTGSGHVTSEYLTEQKLIFPRNRALNISIYLGSRDERVHGFLDVIDFHRAVCMEMNSRSNYHVRPSGTLAEKLKELDKHTQEIYAQVTQVFPNISTSKSTDILGHPTALESAFGICDAVIVALSLPIRHLIDKLSDSTCIFPVRQPENETGVQSEGSVSTHDNEDAETTDENMEGQMAPDALSDATTETIFWPMFIIEYKRPLQSADDAQGLSHCRTSVHASVEFLESIGIDTAKYPVLGLHAEGWKGTIIMGRRYLVPLESAPDAPEDIRRCTYILDYGVEEFDLTDAAQFFHFLVVVGRMLKQAERLQKDLSEYRQQLSAEQVERLRNWSITARRDR
ncbi:hypothetical protein QCA50_008016 [Cerrena zonata]|uniref:Uncharacterized protein n=1 Tax=Cerrena zonata TaxID=2478898 RepID=A0AAW0G487_9APHY